MIYSLVFFAFAFLVVASSIAVVVARNPVHSVLFLIFAFFNASGIMILLGAEFIGMVFIIIYVGAIAILFLFVVMTLNLNEMNIKEYIIGHKKWFVFIGSLFFINILITLYYSFAVRPTIIKATHALILEGMKTNTHQIGEVLYTEYGYLFQICGLILFTAIVGSIFLVHSLNRSQNVKKQNVSEQCARNKKNSLKIAYMKTGRGVDDYNRY
jgi:NADH-quinone oxidoreductase subunit J